MVPLLQDFYVVFVVALGVLGLACSVIASASVWRESRVLELGRDLLNDQTAELFASDFHPDDWMRSCGLATDSHFGDLLLAVYGGWRARRPPGLAELHALGARRERRRLSA